MKRSNNINCTDCDDFGISDFHTHILPGVDDGSRNVEESIKLLHTLYEQGAWRVVLTPHFYAGSNTPEKFFSERERALEVLLCETRKCSDDLPEICIGAEVSFFDGMSNYANLDRFCIEGTRLLLIEMPQERWTESVIEELLHIVDLTGLIPVIAHVDRYISLQKKSILERIYSEDILIQVNADAFLDRKIKKRMIKLLMQGNADILGSDCHRVDWREPKIGEAFRVIEDKLGMDAVLELNRFGEYILKEAKRFK